MTNIFLSYAKEDMLAARQVYLTLKESGLSPWMDSPPKPFEDEGILAGQRWHHVIREKIREADIVLAIFSRNSIEKRGYVQKEYRFALECSMERPIDVPYLIPVLLEPCKPPHMKIGVDGFHELQWFFLYERDANDLAKQILSLMGSIRIENAYEPMSKFEAVALRNRNLMLDNRLGRLNTELTQAKVAIDRLEIELSYTRDDQIDLSNKVAELEKRDPLKELAEGLRQDSRSYGS